MTTAALLRGYRHLPRPLARALAGDVVTIDSLRLRIPGTFPIRASVLAATTRVRAVLDAVLRRGGTFVDVGANIGYVTALAAARVGAGGRVLALEPARDNFAVLEENVRANRLSGVTPLCVAAGRRREERTLFLRGDLSAVNSLFEESCYSSVTGTSTVQVVPVDDLVDQPPDLVKIDVEGGELDVLDGMRTVLSRPAVQLIVEWHPLLQRAAGHDPAALPRFLLDEGFTLTMVGDFSVRPLPAEAVPRIEARLARRGRPVELYARR
ncbi:MAG: FkbM family methyltransferase [Vicinamibacterales bacterium]